MSLKRTAIHGVFWSVVDAIILKGISFVVAILLARWLGPIEFGLMGMIAVFIGLGSTIVDSGLSSSLIRTKDADDKDFSTVFYLNLLLSVLVYAVVFVIAPFIADFFNQDILTSVIRVYCLSFIFSAFSAVQLARLNAKMQFKSITKYNIPAIVLSSVLGLYLGWKGYGIWALVFMYLSNNVIKSLVLWFATAWRPGFCYSRERAAYHYRFGYRMMLSGILDTSFKYLYNVLIGKFYTVKELGFYERGRSFTLFPSQAITSIISKVSYPLLASISDDRERLGVIYKQIFGVTFFITAPLMFGLAAVAEPLFHFLLGDAWLGAVPYFQILCIGSMLTPIHAFNLNIFQVYGRSDLFLKLEVIKKILTVLLAVVGMQFGIFGLVISSVVLSFLALFVNTYYSQSMINYSGRQQLMDLMPIYLISLTMFGLVKFALGYMTVLIDIYQLILAALGGLIFYIGVSYLMKIQAFIFCIRLFKEKAMKYDSNN